MSVNPSSILEGLSVGYVEIFGERDIEKLCFSYKGKDYLIDDQYCMNPACKCNEAILTFIELQQEKETSNGGPFAIRLKLHNNRYETLKQNKRSKKELLSIVDFFIKNNKDTIKLISDRYKEMKEKGREILFQNKEKGSTQENAAIKIGRNDPCPCGSGKKYKKCCGK